MSSYDRASPRGMWDEAEVEPDRRKAGGGVDVVAGLAAVVGGFLALIVVLPVALGLFIATAVEAFEWGWGLARG